MVCGGLGWFAVVWGGLRWFAVIRRTLWLLLLLKKDFEGLIDVFPL